MTDNALQTGGTAHTYHSKWFVDDHERRRLLLVQKLGGVCEFCGKEDSPTDRLMFHYLRTEDKGLCKMTGQSRMILLDKQIAMGVRVLLICKTCYKDTHSALRHLATFPED